VPAPRVYLTVREKFLIAFAVALAWGALSGFLAERWFHDLADLSGFGVALFLIAFIAIIPGFMNAFMIASLVLDQRPPRKPLADYPPVTLIVAAYNEEANIAGTLASIRRQDYPAPVQVILVNDGSRDATGAVAHGIAADWPLLRVIDLPRNAGKSHALNRGLAEARTELIVTVDGDCVLVASALRHLVERYVADPPETRAVAGMVFVRNSRDTWITRAQEWDYFHGIAAVKRVQSLYHGTLVAQGAFSLYSRQALEDVGGWPHGVGEDIILTWALLERGWRVGHAEDACLFTTAPTTLAQFVRQRRRWARGMIEAFKRHPRIVLRARLSTMFILWNTFFPLLDFAYVAGFMPGIVLAFLGHFWVVGPMTLALLPVALAMNAYVHRVQKRTWAKLGLKVRRNRSGFLTYFLAYGFVMQPASVAGYVAEYLRVRKSWGTK
jgi:biofilm PGA synthesis N-glycosyltransferase PgaC